MCGRVGSDPADAAVSPRMSAPVADRRRDVVGGVVAVDPEPLEELAAQPRQPGVRPIARPRARDLDRGADRRPGLIALGAEQDDPVGERERLVDVVRDEQDRRRLRGVDVEQQILHRQARQGVEGTERLVEQQDAGAACEGASERGALGHATGDLARAQRRGL